jgi:hypothetical protein
MGNRKSSRGSPGVFSRHGISSSQSRSQSSSSSTHSPSAASSTKSVSSAHSPAPVASPRPAASTQTMTNTRNPSPNPSAAPTGVAQAPQQGMLGNIASSAIGSMVGMMVANKIMGSSNSNDAPAVAAVPPASENTVEKGCATQLNWLTSCLEKQDGEEACRWELNTFKECQRRSNLANQEKTW